MKFLSSLALFSALPVFGANEPVSFDTALDEILKRSTSIAIQAANLEQTRAAAWPSYAAFVPSLSFDARKDWRQNKNSARTDTRQVEATSQMNLFHWGGDLFGLRAARDDVRSQEATLVDTTHSVEDDAVSALVGELQRAKEVTINNDLVNIETRLLEIARQRYSGGYLPIQEVEKVSIDLDNAKSSLADAEVRESEARARLENLLGHSNVSQDWPWKDKLVAAKPKLLAAELDLSMRPDWQAASARYEAADNRYMKNVLLNLPSLDASAAYGYYSRLGAENNPGWSAALTVTLPFFDHLVTVSNARTQAYAAAAAESSLTQVTRDAKSSWQTAKRNFEIALNAAIAREKTLQTSRKLYQDGFRRFQSGRASANELVIDQKRLYDSELFSIQGWATAHLAYTRLCHALGRSISNCF